MSTSVSDSGMRVYYDFGGLPERIFTRASFLEVLAQFKTFQDPDQGVATVKTVFGDTITMTRGPQSTTEGEEGSYMVTYKHTKLGTAQVKVLPKDEFFIESNSIFTIAEQNEHTKAWETSQLKKDLVQALERNAKQTGQVDLIVCYGLGSLGRYTGARSYFRRLAACTIAKTLSEAQATNSEDSKTVEIFAQDLFYTNHAREHMVKLDPPIMPVDYRINEALMKVNRNTSIVSIGAKSDLSYKQLCIREEVTDDENLGLKPRFELEKIGKVMRNSEGEIKRDEAGNVFWNTNDVYRLDENDRPIMIKLDTELLLRKK
ncbi:hypothetical protein HBI56_114200 [Parastagonospora nodorum]|nr:hypothetical protein HBI09_073650 [Parastagonospora nodorum]KAH4068040.1 hypothetical protein HBH50_121730 [Parastagonospora nodorum]KAH4166923.1 hypothetical protein HBH43_130860 [Parastagonospora nodorum]KAH4274877.1 hypothetical protein HBI03_001280 [Parastagonospora nodorum]KAH4296391.1 hypothetical protein HBI01_147090 [Parastagonospora nodorum]